MQSKHWRQIDHVLADKKSQEFHQRDKNQPYCGLSYFQMLHFGQQEEEEERDKTTTKARHHDE
jgi:hypothetical protein